MHTFLELIFRTHILRRDPAAQAEAKLRADAIQFFDSEHLLSHRFTHDVRAFEPASGVLAVRTTIPNRVADLMNGFVHGNLVPCKVLIMDDTKELEDFWDQWEVKGDAYYSAVIDRVGRCVYLASTRYTATC